MAGDWTTRKEPERRVQERPIELARILRSLLGCVQSSIRRRGIMRKYKYVHIEEDPNFSSHDSKSIPNRKTDPEYYCR